MEPPRSFDVTLRSPKGSVAGTIFAWDESPENSDEMKLRLEYSEVVIERSSDVSYFRALASIRGELERSNVAIECYGASENVYPSPMIESMGNGEKAYRLTMTRPARDVDIVSIFESGPDLIPSTVAQQRHFYDQWISSLK